MDPARFDSIQALFHKVVDLPRAERDAAVRDGCGDDPAIVAEVLALLEEDDRTSILDAGVGHAAGTLIAGGSSSVAEIGPYELVRVIGEGGMGVVYLARRTDLGTEAAIKILRDAWLSPDRRERFRTEQRTLARLNHPAIARLFDAGTLSDGTPWIVMEHVDGVPLKQYCREHALPVRERLRLLRAVAEAVQHAHRHLVVHRDLKPSNVLVTTDGTVKLLDFGIAKQLEDAGVAGERTRTLIRLMTPAYAAPEQIRGEAVGLHTDVYGLGAVLYELLTGAPPLDFTNRSTSQVERMILEQDAARPSAAASDRAGGSDQPPDAQSLARSSWADLDVLCLTAIHKDPARRYQSVEALVRDIDHFLNREPLEARADALGYRVRKFVARNWRPLSAAAAAVIVLAGVVTFYTVRLARARNLAVSEATRAERVQGLMLDIFSGGEDGAAPAEYLRVIDVLDRGRLAADSIANEPTVQAELFQTLGTIYGQLGRFADADTLMNQGLERTRAAFGSDSIQTAQTLVALGRLRLEQGKLTEADQAVRDGLAMTRRHVPAGDPQIARALTMLGRVLEERGEYAEATKSLEEAEALLSKRAQASVERAAVLRHLGNVNFYAGNLDEADRYFARVLAMTRQVSGQRHALVADDLINLGAVQFERGRHAEAEKYYREALPIIEGWFGKEHSRAASNLTMLGRAIVAQGRYEDAVPLLERAVAIQERVFGPVSARVASAVNELGTVALRRADYDAAEAAFKRMAGIYRQVYPGKHFLTAIAISNLASVYIARKEFARAEPVFREAIALYSDTQGPAHLNTGIARLKLGRALIGLGRHAEAEKEQIAGYDIIRKLPTPPANWLKIAREDLLKLYTAWNRPAQAEKFKAELAGAVKQP
jgi:serine/threonine protein kinase/tetratricopeptide (TPR) repeat protein